jgi:hypothetical protein
VSSVRDLEIARLRAMSASEKIAAMQSLWEQAWALKAAGVSAQHPEWTAEQVEARVREIFRQCSS